jgi:hypothetical protein
MIKRNNFLRNLLFALVFLFAVGDVLSKDKIKRKTKIKYKSYTELDFSGMRVDGKARTPEIFYIFQRKKASQHEVLEAPSRFDYLIPEKLQAIENHLKP